MADFRIPITEYGDGKGVTVATLPVADAETDLNLTALYSAVAGVTLGNIGQCTLNISDSKDTGPGGVPSSKYAQKEMRWLCRYIDAVTLKKHTLEIGTAEAQLLADGTDYMDLADGAAGEAFKTAFDAYVKDPETGNAVTLVSAELVGRK